MAHIFQNSAWGAVALFISNKCCACDSLPPSTRPSKATAAVQGQCPRHAARGAVLLSLEQVKALVVSAVTIQILLRAFVCYLAGNAHTVI